MATKTKAQLMAEIEELNQRLENAKHVYVQQKRELEQVKKESDRQGRTIETLREANAKLTLKADAYDKINAVTYETYRKLHPKTQPAKTQAAS